MSPSPVRLAAVGPRSGRLRLGFSALAVVAGMASSPAFWAQSLAGSGWEVSWGSQEPADVDSPSVIYSVRLGPDGSWFNSAMDSLNSGWISAGPGDPNSTLGGGLYSSPNRGNSGGNFVVVGTTPDGNIRYDVSLDPGGLGGLPPPPPIVPPAPTPTAPIDSSPDSAQPMVNILKRTGVATCTVTQSRLTAVVVVDGGSGYAQAPMVTIHGGGGSGARAEARVSGGSIVEIVVTASGEGFTSPPEVFIAPPKPAPEVSVQFGGEDWVRLSLKVVPGRTYQLLNSADLKKWVPLDEPFQATSDAVTGDFLTDRRRQFFRLDEIQ